MGVLTENIALRDRQHVFEDRTEAGRLLAHALMHLQSSECMVLAIPSGGIPVAFEIANALHLPVDLLIVRKIQIPFNTEAGFGAMSPDGEIILNEKLLRQLKLTEDEISTQIKQTFENIQQRNRLFREGRPYPRLERDPVVIVDDGLASGFTMLAAIAFIRKGGARKITVAVPTGSENTIQFILPEVDELYCLNIRSGFPFAVADAYRNWYDLADKEVMAIVKRMTISSRMKRRIRE
jgi:putative phosphoribosyl transferase